LTGSVMRNCACTDSEGAVGLGLETARDGLASSETWCEETP